MNTAESVQNMLLGKVKMEKSYHEGVEFLNPGDTFLLTEKHWNVSREIDAYLEKEGLIQEGKKLVIAVSGPSGSGKSEIGYTLGAYLGKRGFRCVCYSTDNCYRIEPGIRAQNRKVAFERGALSSVISKDEYDWELIGSIEDALRTEKSAQTPVVDITKAERPIGIKSIDYSQYDVLILDGLYALAGSCDVKVYLQQTWDGIIHAQKERGKETTDELRTAVLKSEMKEVERLFRESTGRVIDVAVDGKVSVVN